ncbi:SP_0009 family protein [Streptococcus caballi]|nr:SP_0009 family protein [Streptococcus caballi]
MEHLIEVVEKFLAYSDEKLEELKKKNQSLRENSDVGQKKH